MTSEFFKSEEEYIKRQKEKTRDTVKQILDIVLKEATEECDYAFETGYNNTIQCVCNKLNDYKWIDKTYQLHKKHKLENIP